MRDEVAKLVFPIIVGGLDLRERLARGDARLDLRRAQEPLKKGLLVRSPGAEEFWGDEDRKPGPIPRATDDVRRRLTTSFLGIRYALASWLDEIFTEDTCPWKDEWNNHKLEVAFFSPTAERAWIFWEQARMAETRPDDDALEVFFLCVMLGFRGDWGREPDRLKDWIDRTRARVTRGQASPPLPTELELVPHHPPHRGRDRFARMLVVGAVILVAALGAVLISFNYLPAR
jgi:type VI secretion system protein ImpK